MTTDTRALPVAVIGAGPVGLAAAAHLIERGVPVRVYEAGATVAASVREWGHVRLFSPWRFNTDRAAARSSSGTAGRSLPADAFPTGRRSLRRLSAAARRNARDARRHRDRHRRHGDHPARRRQGVGNRTRDKAVRALGRERRRRSADLARAVIDASGTWTSPTRSAPADRRPMARPSTPTGSPTGFPTCSDATAHLCRQRASWWSAPATRRRTC